MAEIFFKIAAAAAEENFNVCWPKSLFTWKILFSLQIRHRVNISHLSHFFADIENYANKQMNLMNFLDIYYVYVYSIEENWSALFVDFIFLFFS